MAIASRPSRTASSTLMVGHTFPSKGFGVKSYNLFLRVLSPCSSVRLRG